MRFAKKTIQLFFTILHFRLLAEWAVSCHQNTWHILGVTIVTLMVSGECLQAESSAPPLPWSRSASPHTGVTSPRPLIGHQPPVLSPDWLEGRHCLPYTILSVRAPGHGTRPVTDQSPSPGTREWRERGGDYPRTLTVSRAQHVTPSGHNRGH